MEAILNLKKDYSSTQIETAVSTLNRYREAHGQTLITSWKIETEEKEAESVQTSDHQPCGECGGSFFLRTGTCHVCQTCGASQGCS